MRYQGIIKGSLKRVIQIISQLKKTGASSCKLQSFDLNEMTLNIKNKNFLIKDKVIGKIIICMNYTKKLLLH